MSDAEKERVAAEIRSRTENPTDEETVSAVLERYDERTTRVAESAHRAVQSEFGVKR